MKSIFLVVLVLIASSALGESCPEGTVVRFLYSEYTSSIQFCIPEEEALEAERAIDDGEADSEEVSEYFQKAYPNNDDE